MQPPYDRSQRPEGVTVSAEQHENGEDAATTTLRVRNELRHAILDGSIAPGTRLRAAAVAERFNG
jgi:DNA-binding GntR family transcriptional regulator